MGETAEKAAPHFFCALKTLFQESGTISKTVKESPLLANGASYTPQDYRQLLQDAGLGYLPEIADYYIGFVEFADPHSFPNVDVYAEKGSGLPTPVSITSASPATTTFSLAFFRT